MLPDVISERNVLGGICEHVCVFFLMRTCAVCACLSEWVAEAGFFLFVCFFFYCKALVVAALGLGVHNKTTSGRFSLEK